MKKRFLVILLIVSVSLLFCNRVFAARLAPKEVSPVIFNGIEYTPIYNINAVTMQGLIRAKEVDSGKILWELENIH